jgi:hypothetical protein
MKISKSDLWGIISIIGSAMLLSLAIAIESNSVFVTFVMCVLFTTFCFHLVTFSIKLFNVYREEKELNNFMDELVNCPDRITPPRFKKGDWIINNKGFEYNLGYCLQIEEVVTDGSDNYYNIRTYNKGVIQYHAPFIERNYRLATPEEIQYHKEHYSQPQS